MARDTSRYLAVSCVPQSGVSQRVNLVMEHLEEGILTLLLHHKVLCYKHDYIALPLLTSCYNSINGPPVSRMKKGIPAVLA